MIDDVMRARRSVRSFLPEVPPREAIERVLEAAVTAPSASNKQPWRFFVVSNRDTIASMARVVREAVDRIALHVPSGTEAAFRAYGEYFTRFETAPVVIVPIFRGVAVLSHLVDVELPAHDRDQIAAMERDSGLVGASLALENLLLMAHDLGMGASAMTGALVAADAIKTILDIPAGWGIVALVPLGYAAESPVVTPRKPISKVTRWIP
ncbi:MAG: nitroreductase family protein [Deltaproteobacteria bacterium]